MLQIERVRGGRRDAAGRCVKRRRGPRCIRYVRVGTLTRSGADGANAIAFDGRIGLRRLRRGAYRLTVIASDAAGNESTPRRVLFRIKKRRR